MDEFGDLTKQYGIKAQGKSAPMASSKQRPNKPTNSQTSNSVSSSSSNPKSTYNSSSGNGSSFNVDETLFVSNKKAQNFDGLGDFNNDDFDVFGGFQKNSTHNNGNGSSSLNLDPFFPNSNYSSAKSSFDDDIFSGFNSSSSVNNNNNNKNNTDGFFGSFVSKPSQSAQVDDLLGDFSATLKPPSQNGSVGFDDLIPGFGNASINSSNKGENTGMNNSTYTSTDDPFLVLESISTTSKSTFTDPLEEFSKVNHSGSTKRVGSSNIPSPLKPPPKPGQVLKSDEVQSSSVSFIDELEEFGMVKVRNNVDGHSNVRYAKEARERQMAKTNRHKEAEDATWKNLQTSADDIESILNMGSRSSSAPKSRASTLDPVFNAKTNSRGEPAVAQNKSGSASSGIKKASSTTSIVDDFPSMFGDASFFGEFEEVEGESEERRRARLGRHQRTQDRMAKAVADMNQRDLQTQHEQEERRRLADIVDADIKRWTDRRKDNMRALLSSLETVLWPECGWEPVPMVDLISSASVKKVYRKATLCVHPDKVQQKGATLEQKYTAEKVFDILKESWKKFEKEELS